VGYELAHRRLIVWRAAVLEFPRDGGGVRATGHGGRRRALQLEASAAARIAAVGDGSIHHCLEAPPSGLLPLGSNLPGVELRQDPAARDQILSPPSSSQPRRGRVAAALASCPRFLSSTASSSHSRPCHRSAAVLLVSNLSCRTRRLQLLRS
jgi:hypothetical protein